MDIPSPFSFLAQTVLMTAVMNDVIDDDHHD
jgi:hypothetical protein